YPSISVTFRFYHPTTTEIYTLSLHDALPIFEDLHRGVRVHLADPAQHHQRGPHRRSDPAEAGEVDGPVRAQYVPEGRPAGLGARSEEHTSELQSRENLVCRLLLEK